MDNLKALIEQHNKKLDEIDAIYDKGIEETRSLTDDEENEIAKLQKDAKDLKSKIDEEEKRSLETSVEVKGEDEIMDKQVETRAMEDFIRGNENEEVRAMLTSDANSIIPESLDKNIITKLEEVAPLFNDVQKFTPVAGTLNIPVEDETGSAGFVGEGEGTDESKFSMKTIDLTQKRAGSEIVLSQFLINDAGIPIVDYSQKLLFRRLGNALDRAMINGKVANKSIEGLESVDASRNYAGDFVIETFSGALASMKAEVQSGAKWIMNRKTFEQVCKLTNKIGELYVMRDVVNGKVIYKLFSLPIAISDAVADGEVFLANIKVAYRGMVKKGATLTKIDSDTTNRRNGTVTLILDTYVDARIVQPEAIVRVQLSSTTPAKSAPVVSK